MSELDNSKFDKDKTFRVSWNEKTISLYWECPEKETCDLVQSVFSRPLITVEEGAMRMDVSFLQELEHKGYDIRTLHFSVSKK